VVQTAQRFSAAVFRAPGAIRHVLWVVSMPICTYLSTNHRR
jgi:hypothetical protein